MTSETAAIVKGVLRGERSVDDLESAGVKVEHRESGLYVEAPRGFSVVMTLSDAARALVRLSSRFQDLREWAQFVLASPTTVVLEAGFEASAEGEALLSAIWDGAFGSRPSTEALAAAQRVLEAGSSS